MDSELGMRTGSILRNFESSVAKDLSMKAKPFAPVSTSADDLTPYPLRDRVHGIVKCFPPINWLRSIACRLIPYPRAESFSRAPLLAFRRPKSLLRER